ARCSSSPPSGKSFLGTVGTGFTPHVIIIPSGEDVAARIMSFSQQGPRAVCIMSASGAVSTATLHQDAGSGSVVKYEGSIRNPVPLWIIPSYR
uniref:AT-hook motif nuclear-localized protein n=1 Tax=Aegilops tauschii subsp. strangulata TaxID=200361 RepID=A0A453TDZ2_AEGTS